MSERKENKIAKARNNVLFNNDNINYK